MAYCLALFTLSIFASLVSVSAGGLSLRVSGPAQVDDISGLHIITTLKNTGTSALTLVNHPGSVLSRSPTNIFSISHESGAKPDFTGIMVKYSPDFAAKGGAVTTISPGQSIEVTHFLAGTYDFTNSGPGTYEISPTPLFHAVSEAGNPQRIYGTLENSHTVIISGSGRLAVPRQSGHQKRYPGLKKRAEFRGCSDDRQLEVNGVFGPAVNLVNDALSHLDSNQAETERFKAWFGSFTFPHRTSVINNYRSLNASESFLSWTYDCNCDARRDDPGTWAYVDASDYGVVHLCQRFWVSPTLGTDSMAGTLVHEGLHFTRTAGLRDIAAGKPACANLAITNPDQAIQNADSHQYFAENANPTLG